MQRPTVIVNGDQIRDALFLQALDKIASNVRWCATFLFAIAVLLFIALARH